MGTDHGQELGPDHGRARWQRRYDAARLRNADFTTAKRIAAAVNDYLGARSAEQHGQRQRRRRRGDGRAGRTGRRSAIG